MAQLVLLESYNTEQRKRWSVKDHRLFGAVNLNQCSLYCLCLLPVVDKLFTYRPIKSCSPGVRLTHFDAVSFMN